jgi:hypothetical protein
MPWEVPKEKDLAAQKPPRATVSFPFAGVRSALVLIVCRMLLFFWLELLLLLFSRLNALVVAGKGGAGE